jgi:hypothetical protein
MTAPRLGREPVPFTLIVDGLPARFLLPSGPPRGTDDGRRHGKIFLEMRDPHGRLYILTTDGDIQRVHMEGFYVATCVFDAYGSWHLTWHGLSEKEEQPIEVLVVQGEPC